MSSKIEGRASSMGQLGAARSVRLDRTNSCKTTARASKQAFDRTRQRLREIERVIVRRHVTLPATDDVEIYLIALAQTHRALLIKAGKTATVDDIVDRLAVSKVVGPGLVYRQLRDAAVAAIDNPRMGKADAIAAKLMVTDDERVELKLRSIGAHDVDKQERARRRKECNRQRAKERAARLRAERRAMTREAYLAQAKAKAAARVKPWEQAGVSRATWYRRARETGVSFPITLSVSLENQPCLTEPAARPGRWLPMQACPSRPSHTPPWSSVSPPSWMVHPVSAPLTIIGVSS